MKVQNILAGMLLSLSLVAGTALSARRVYLVNNIQDSVHVLNLESIDPFVVPKPNFDGELISSGQVSKKPHFEQLESKNASSAVFKDWLTANKLIDLEYLVPTFSSTKNNVPKEIPLVYKEYRLTKGLHYSNYDIFFYGTDFSKSRFLLVTNKERTKIVQFLDFENYTQAPETKEGDEDYIYQQLQWADIDQNGVLYVTTAHNTYASSSLNKNAYLTAISTTDNKVLWRSKPLVSNYNFVVLGDYIISGYGFTKEKDYLYALDKRTGQTLNKTLLKSEPSYIGFKNNRLYILTYNTSYQFKVSK